MRNLIGSAALAAGLMLGSAALAASPQAAPADAATTTSAAPVVQRDVVGRTEIGAPVVGVTASQSVRYGDLDLANPADAKVLDQRIRSAAEADCTELRDQSRDAMIPVTPDARCVRMAEQDARSSLNAAVSGANALQ